MSETRERVLAYGQAFCGFAIFTSALAGIALDLSEAVELVVGFGGGLVGCLVCYCLHPIPPAKDGEA